MLACNGVSEAGAEKVVAIEVQVPDLEQPTRLDEALLHLLPDQFPTLTRSKRGIRRGEVLVQGARGKTTV